ncbi:hypothetical protein [Nonomuraea zeae]|uniref:Uncharacterized protein n=1 Tax=Nonomuraea zeae TaxID=1642303 RepID=A0A5S4GW26_9ACTN|nr:hypothetical protein [Nonomuraea zeae]TMR36969.1 hypothetical protein ETD85_09470 [Nonomuraea zeae]
MDSSLYVLVEDLRGEGVEKVLDRVRGYGVAGITVGAVHHESRDITPHGLSKLTLRHDGAHFDLPGDLFAELRLVPPAGYTDAFDGLLDACRARGLKVHGRTVFLRNGTLGAQHPDVSVRNCFGDRGFPTDLCPAHPEVRQYAVALARSVARLGVDSVVAEGLHYRPLKAERSFVPLGPMDAYLMALCFCDFCMARASDLGVDAGMAREECARIVGGLLEGDAPAEGEVTRAALTAYAGPDVVGYARARCATVTSLVSQVADAVASEGSRLVFVDPTGAVKGYRDGLPSPVLAAYDGWQLGVDPVALSDLMLSFTVLAYARDATRVADDVDAYLRSVGKDRQVRAVLRPGYPDSDSADRLTAKVHGARAAGAHAVDFYAYGLASHPVLDRIPHALS